MEFTAIIAEFNPLTKGHKHLIEEAKRLYPNSLILVIMSGSFVQRGTPSILPKHTRAKHANICGVDAVIELPVIYSLSSAEDFAYGAISILNSIPSVKRIIFGSECGDITLLKICVKELETETDQLRDEIRTNLKHGISYAKSVISTNCVLSSPNNLLGAMYIQALNKMSSTIDPITIKRENNYNSEELSSIPSATAIRTLVKSGKTSSLKGLVPEHTLKDLKAAPEISVDKLYNLISYKILTSTPSTLNDINGITEGLENKIFKENLSATSYDKFVEALTSKRYFRNKIQRICSNILLNITKEDVRNLKDLPYIKVLSVNKENKNIILKELACSSIPLITKMKDLEKIPLIQRKLIEKDFLAEDIYSILTGTTKQQDAKNKI